MNFLLPVLRLLACAAALGTLCQCSSPKDEKKGSAEMSLAQRAMLKPNENHRSQFEKYIGGTGLKNGAGAHFQKQIHHSKAYGANSFAGQKQFKAEQSIFGKSKAKGGDMTYSLGDKKSAFSSNNFKAGESRFGQQAAREGSSKFSGGDDIFSTGSALSRSKARPREPKIIETIETTSTKNSAYSEDEVKKLLGR